MINYDKIEIKNSLTLDNIFELLNIWGGNPEYSEFGILSETICHNEPGVGSKKLYYYSNSQLFKCYTGCDNTFDIFELVIKVANIQSNKEYDLNDAVRWVANYFDIAGSVEQDAEDLGLEDWKFLANYDKNTPEENLNSKVELKIYDSQILSRFNYQVKITPWLKEGISQEAIDQAIIGYYPGGDAITIPHFDINGNFIGLRGRILGKEEATLYGKYRPLKINKILYSHPLGMNLYNLNNSKANISRLGKAIIFEGEKSTLQYQSYFGFENDITVACCGSSVSAQQMKLLEQVGAKDIIIAFDRQFQKIGDEEFYHLKNNLLKIKAKYGNYFNISFIFDKNMLTNYKDSPTDEGPDLFLKLYKERIII
jgi:hypothetical protein